MHLRTYTMLLLLALLCQHGFTENAVPAFPGAEGYGANAVGGRGGQALFVTNLDDYDPETEKAVPGSLRTACLTAGPRTIIFSISGTIPLKAPLVITEPYLTLAGRAR